MEFSALEFSQWLQEKNTFEGVAGIRCRKMEVGYCEVEAEVETGKLNPAGNAHGGFLFTMVDIASGVAASMTKDGYRRLVTQNASIFYLRGAQCGEKLWAGAQVVHSGRSTSHVQAKVFNEAGDVLVRGELTFFHLNGIYRSMEELRSGM